VNDLAARLAAGAAALKLTLSEQQCQQLSQLLQELARWNKTYNLTAITSIEEGLTHHLLDSLSAHHRIAGHSVADVGTGAGFPGLPLAIVQPARQFTLIDAVDKKLRFVDHIARELGLANVKSLHARVEQLKPVTAFDTVIARAYAPLPRLVETVTGLCNTSTQLIAMKGRWPEPRDAGPLPAGWEIKQVEPITVPGLAEARHLIVLQRAC
jgi:16S rRNA (guanine527-N7)-methyltransferase